MFRTSILRRVMWGALVGWIVCGSSAAVALDPSLDISKYGHTVWRNLDAIGPGTIGPIAQTTDGYLWLGTPSGLLRFDGVRSVAWHPPAGAALPDDRIRALLGGRDGTLWIGHDARGRQLEGRQAAHVPVAQGQDGQRPGAGSRRNPLGRRLAGRGGIPLRHPQGRRRLPQPRRALRQRDRGAVAGHLGRPLGLRHRSCLASQARAGAFLSASLGDRFAPDDGGHARWRDDDRHARRHREDLERSGPDPASRRRRARPALHEGIERPRWRALDRDHRLRAVAPARGAGGYLYRVRRSVRRSGPRALRGSRGQRLGLDLARPRPLPADGGGDLLARADGIKGRASSIIAAHDGSLWASTSAMLYRFDHGQVSPVQPSRSATLFEDRRGRMWSASQYGIGYIEGGRFVAAPGISARRVDGIVEDAKGSMWFATRDAGLLRLRPDGTVERTGWAELGLRGRVSTMLVDPADDGLWLGMWSGAVVNVFEGKVRRSFLPPGTQVDSIGPSTVRHLRLRPGRRPLDCQPHRFDPSRSRSGQPPGQSKRHALRRRLLVAARRAVRVGLYNLRPGRDCQAGVGGMGPCDGR